MKIYDSKEYLEGQIESKTYSQIAEEHNISKRTIQRKLTQFGLTKPLNLWNEREIQLLKKNYEAGKDIYLLFPNRTRSSIYHKAHKTGLPRLLRKRYKKINENFFKKWTIESSYVLGWMFSDGNVSKDGRTFGFHLSKKDIEILKKIKKVLNSEHKISVRENYVEFKMHSKKMCQDLISLGCLPKKALKIRFPEKIPQKYINHFVRGYFDGDGSIHFNHPNTIKIKIVGNRKFINILRKKVSNIIKTKLPKMKENCNIWEIGFYGDSARKFCRWIYKDCANLYLDRKRILFENHVKKRGGV